MIYPQVLGDAERLGSGSPDGAGELAEGVEFAQARRHARLHLLAGGERSPVAVPVRVPPCHVLLVDGLGGVLLPYLIDSRVVARVEGEMEPDGVVADVVAGQVVRGLLRVDLAVRDTLHDLGRERLREPRFVVYDKWVTYTLADAGWLAGIIDGEGTVSLVKGQSGPILRITIYNGSEEILSKIRRILTAMEVPFMEGWDRRAARANCHITMATASCRRLTPLIRPHLVRHADRLDAAMAFLEPAYQGRSRVHWTSAQRAEWEALRLRFNAS